MNPSVDGTSVLESTMMGRHGELDAGFFAHQRALLDRDFARAGRLLDEFRGRLEQHADDEEQFVLPRYEQLGGDATDAPTKLFRGEHRNLREFTADFVQRVARLQQHPDDKDLLDLFDRQATFKNLMLHHDLRERNLLYPFLGARLPAAEQQAIVAALRWR